MADFGKSERQSYSQELSNINAAVVQSASSRPDVESQKEQDDYAKARLKSLLQDIEERKKYALWIFSLVAGWIVAILAILLFAGFGAHRFFFLSDKVLLAAIGSTTVNVIGIFFIVVRYLFSRDSR